MSSVRDSGATSSKRRVMSVHDYLVGKPMEGAASNGVAEAALLDYFRLACEPEGHFGVDVLDFGRYVTERAQHGALPPARYAADLLLACACSRGIEPAIRLFQREYGVVMARVLQHRKASADVAEDVQQIVNERLLVGDPSRGIPPKIGMYQAAGPLKAWVATTTATTLLTLRRSSSRRRERSDDTPEAALANVQLNPELDYLKERYKAEVEDAIQQAIGLLDDRECTLLHLHLTERLSIDVLGSMYSVNRATAARWLAAARRKLLDLARERLRAALRLSDSECDSLVALVNTGLDVSIARRLSERRPT
jgi:RNA polymerase sigma-70 factor, ECF subfamily